MPTSEMADPMDASDEMLYKMAAVNLARRNVAIDAGLAAAEGSEQSHENALEQLVASVQDDEASLVLLLYRLGVRHINGGRYDDARECLSSVLDMDSSHSRARDALATAMFNAGVTALNDGKPSAAAEMFESVVDFEPGHQGALRGLLSAQHNLGVEALEKGDCEGARYHFSEVLREDPAHKSARQASCSVDIRQSSELMRRRDFKAALPFLERAEGLFGDDRSQNESRVACAYNRAVCNLELNRVPEARWALQAALKLDSRHAPSLKAEPVIRRRVEAYKKKHADYDPDAPPPAPPPQPQSALLRAASKAAAPPLTEARVSSTESLAASKKGAISDSAFVGAALACAIEKRHTEPDLAVDEDGDDCEDVVRRRYALQPESDAPPSTRAKEFIFNEFAPKTFARIRALTGVPEASYVSAMTSKRLTGGAKGEGKSGSYFFFSHDSRFIAKTVNSGELRFLRSVLGEYLEYLEVEAKTTLLCRFVGLYSINRPGKSTAEAKCLVVMRNVMQQHVSYEAIYDLKGSLRGRFVSEAEQEAGTVVLKDQNFSNDVGHRMDFGPGRREGFVMQLRRDAEFLASHNVMDYSLILGVTHDSDAMRSKCDTRWQRKGCHKAYDLGIIDILQVYNMRKKVENAFKTRSVKMGGGDPTTISCVDPRAYGQRFTNFVEHYCD